MCYTYVYIKIHFLNYVRNRYRIVYTLGQTMTFKS